MSVNTFAVPASASSHTAAASETGQTISSVPEFAVATVKLSAPDMQGQGISMKEGRFAATNFTVKDLIAFAYGIHASQLQNLPKWANVIKFDIQGVPDSETRLDLSSYKLMLQKLLATRWNLRFHTKLDEIPVFELTALKTEKKLQKSDPMTPGPGLLNMRLIEAGMEIVGRNANIDEFASTLQSAVFDKPVVNSTGLVGRFDFNIVFTPDERVFGGAPIPHRESWDAPSFFTAIAQVGLKITSTRKQINTIVVDSVEQPSPN